MLYFLQFNRLTNSLSCHILIAYSMEKCQYISQHWHSLHLILLIDPICWPWKLDVKEGIFLHRKTKTQIIFISSANKKLYVCCNFLSWRIEVGGVKIRNQINCARTFLPTLWVPQYLYHPRLNNKTIKPKNIMLQNITVECTSENLIKNNFVSSSQLDQQFTQYSK